MPFCCIFCCFLCISSIWQHTRRHTSLGGRSSLYYDGSSSSSSSENVFLRLGSLFASLSVVFPSLFHFPALIRGRRTPQKKKKKTAEPKKAEGKRFPIIKSTRAGVSTGKAKTERRERESEQERERGLRNRDGERGHASYVVSWLKKFPVFLERHKKVVDINIIIEVAKI